MGTFSAVPISALKLSTKCRQLEGGRKGRPDSQNSSLNPVFLPGFPGAAGGPLIVPLGDEIAQRQQTVGEMHIFHDGAAVGLRELHVGEVPDGLDPVVDQLFGNLNRHVLRNGERNQLL